MSLLPLLLWMNWQPLRLCLLACTCLTDTDETCQINDVHALYSRFMLYVYAQCSMPAGMSSGTRNLRTT